MYICDEMPVYIGKGVRDRAYVHLQAAKSDRETITVFQRRLRARLQRGSAVSVEIISSELDESVAYELEKLLIANYRRLGTLMNMTEGGDSPPSHQGRRFPNRKSPSTKGRPGKKWTEEQRQRHQKRMMEFMQSEDIRKRISDGKKGRPGMRHTEESRAKISIAQRRPSAAKALSKTGALNPMFGRRWFHHGNLCSLFFPHAVPDGWLPGKK